MQKDGILFIYKKGLAYCNSPLKTAYELYEIKHIYTEAS